MSIPWNPIGTTIIPEKTEILTKIDDDKGVRNVQSLIYDKGLWWTPDYSTYVYYSPTHWRYIWSE